MSRTDPPFGPQTGRKMMESLFLSNWQHEKNGEKLGNAGTGIHRSDNDEIRVRGDIESKRMEDQRRAERARGRGRGVPSYKRRRQRGGAAAPAPRLAEMEK